MYTAKWWWQEQEKLPAGSTVCSIIIMSDTTHLTSYVGDKKAWSVYMTLGNIPATQRMKLSTQSTMLIGLLPVKFRHSTQYGWTQERQKVWNETIAHDVIREMFACFYHPHDDASPGRYFYNLCHDGKYRLFYPRIAAWLADYPEQLTIQNLRENSCPWCEIPKTSLGK